MRETMNKPTVKLKDGNAFGIMAACRRAAKKAGWTDEEVSKVVEEMKSGDYDHLLQTAMKYFEVNT
jgi:hypothetical protein